MRSKKFILAAAAAAALTSAICAASGAAYAQSAQSATVIVIDYGRILATSDAGRNMTQQLNDMGRAAQAPLQTEAQALDQERQRIQQSTQGMTQEQVQSNSSLTSQINQYGQRVQTFEQCQRVLARDLGFTRDSAIQDFNTQITPVVTQVMQARGAGIVLDSGAVQLAQPAFNATDEVIQHLNQTIHTVTVTKREAPVEAAPAGATAEQQQQVQDTTRIVNDCRTRFRAR